MTLVAVRSLYVKCALKVRNLKETNYAASDCCGASATSAVLHENGLITWRCSFHIGMIDVTGKLGPVVSHVLDDSDEPKD